jgi:hypothetical protein
MADTREFTALRWPVGIVVLALLFLAPFPSFAGSATASFVWDGLFNPPINTCP